LLNEFVTVQRFKGSRFNENLNRTTGKVNERKLTVNREPDNLSNNDLAKVFYKDNR